MGHFQQVMGHQFQGVLRAGVASEAPPAGGSGGAVSPRKNLGFFAFQDTPRRLQMVVQDSEYSYFLWLLFSI